MKLVSPIEIKARQQASPGGELGWWMLVLLFAVLFGALLWPAFVNGGPIWFPDSVEYLSMGERFWKSTVCGASFDYYGQRSILYSAILFLLHWNISSWPVIVFHGVLVSTNSIIALRALYPQITSGKLLSTVLITILTTGLSVYVCFLMPDVLAGVTVLAMVTLFREGHSLHSPAYVWVALSFWYGIVSHSANVLLCVGAVGSYCAVSYLYREKLKLESIASVGGVLGIAVMSLLIVHHQVYGQFALQNPRQPVFAMARVLADEPGNTYFRERHNSLTWEVCRYAEEMPKDAGEILWGKPGIWNRSAAERRKLKAEESSVVGTIVFSDPWLQTRSSLQNVWRLFSSPVDYRILRSQSEVVRLVGALPSMKTEYLNSRQADQHLSLSSLRVFHEVGYWTTLFGASTLFLMNRFRFQITFFALVILWNTVIAGTLSGPMPRYHERLTWVLTLVTAAAFMQVAKSDGPVSSASAP